MWLSLGPRPQEPDSLLPAEGPDAHGTATGVSVPISDSAPSDAGSGTTKEA